MPQLRERVELAFEQQLEVRALLELLLRQQLLERDHTSGAVIRGSMDDRHAAASELFVELVALGEANSCVVWRLHGPRGRIPVGSWYATLLTSGMRGAADLSSVAYTVGASVCALRS